MTEYFVTHVPGCTPAWNASISDCLKLFSEGHRWPGGAPPSIVRITIKHDRSTMSVAIAFVAGFFIHRTKNIRLGAYMQASGAVSRVRQARAMRASSDKRGCPHESRRGHAFCRTSGACLQHDRSCRSPSLMSAVHSAATRTRHAIAQTRANHRYAQIMMSDTRVRRNTQAIQESGHALRDSCPGGSDTHVRADD